VQGIGGEPVTPPQDGLPLNTVNFPTATPSAGGGGTGGDAGGAHADTDAGTDGAIALGRELQTRSLLLLDKFAIGGGSRIDYACMRRSDALRDYIVLAASLQHMPLIAFGAMTDAQKLSFFANLYNAFIVHATCVLGVCEDSPAARTAFFSGASGARYNIAGLSFSPDELEHGILRANTRHPYSTPDGQTTYLVAGDAREGLSISPDR